MPTTVSQIRYACYIFSLLINITNGVNHDYLSEVYLNSCIPCTIDSDCYYSNITNSTTSIWECHKEIIIPRANDDNDTMIEIGICRLDSCDDDDDCFELNHSCFQLNCCNKKDEFYNHENGLFSSICLPSDICNMNTTTDYFVLDDICYVGSDNITYSSPEESILCGDVCPVAMTNCSDIINNIEINDKSEVCDTSTFIFHKCFEFLFNEYYATAIIIFVLFFSGCCICCICFFCRKTVNKMRYRV